MNKKGFEPGELGSLPGAHFLPEATCGLTHLTLPASQRLGIWRAAPPPRGVLSGRQREAGPQEGPWLPQLRFLQPPGTPSILPLPRRPGTCSGPRHRQNRRPVVTLAPGTGQKALPGPCGWVEGCSRATPEAPGASSTLPRLPRSRLSLLAFVKNTQCHLQQHVIP